MSTPNFRAMSPEAFKAFHPHTEEEARAHEEEAQFRAWCEEEGEDPMDESARDNYHERREETEDKFWDNLDEDDRAGWEDNMNRD